MSVNHQPIIYLDNNATTQVDPAVFEAMLPWLARRIWQPVERLFDGQTRRRRPRHRKGAGRLPYQLHSG